MRTFMINKGATLPYLEMEPIADGRNSFDKLYMALQSADVTFTMTDAHTGVKRIANAKAYVVAEDSDGGCEERYKIQYRWNKSDTDVAGVYKGTFRLRFSDNVSVDGLVFPKGDLIVPIEEELMIVVNDQNLKI
ncbi:MAG: hypothetical protein LUD72_01590 [Bacteroidales bacterium]|nr:hypothetical protein [Bacteroidales bacterium]